MMMEKKSIVETAKTVGKSKVGKIAIGVLGGLGLLYVGYRKLVGNAEYELEPQDATYEDIPEATETPPAEVEE